MANRSDIDNDKENYVTESEGYKAHFICSNSKRYEPDQHT